MSEELGGRRDKSVGDVDVKMYEVLGRLVKAGVIEGTTHTGMKAWRQYEETLKSCEKERFELLKIVFVLHALSVATDSEDDLDGISNLLAFVRARAQILDGLLITQDCASGSGGQRKLDTGEQTEHAANTTNMVVGDIHEDEWDVASMHVAQTLELYTSQFIDSWNTIVPSYLTQLSPTHVIDADGIIDKDSNNNSTNNSSSNTGGERVADAIETVKRRTMGMMRRTEAVNWSTVETWKKATNVMQEALKRALSSTEEDTKERSKSGLDNDDASENREKMEEMPSKRSPGEGDNEESWLNVHVKMQTARGRAIGSKINLIRAELANFTYTTESVQALRTLSSKVSQRIDETQALLNSRTSLLRQYETLNPDHMMALVEKYAHAKRQLDQALWNLRELGLD